MAAFQDWLRDVDVAQLSDRERIDLVARLERLKGSASASQARSTHALRCSRERIARQDAARSVGSEVALARRESPTLGDQLVGLSRALVTELPETMKALTAGAIGERHAMEVVKQSATLTVGDRAELDRRLGPVLGRLGVRGVGNAARRIAAELDAASVVRRMEAAARSRRVSVRPAPDGMAYLTVLAPMPEVVGAYAALRARAVAVVGGQCPDEAPEGRGIGAVMADTAMRLLSGRALGQVQPVEVHLVMTDRALTGHGDPRRSVFEPARVPGCGSIPAAVARAWLRAGTHGPAGGDGTAGPAGGDGTAAPAGGDGTAGPAGGAGTAGPAGGDGGAAGVAAAAWLRRLYTGPDGRDLVAMDSRRRAFTGLLRRMLVLRDDVCTTPWCGAPIAHADHATPAREGGATSFEQGNGKCARCNQTKEAPGWVTRVTGLEEFFRDDDPDDADGDEDDQREERGGSRRARRALEVRTPLGRVYRSESPPLLGWGSIEYEDWGYSEHVGWGAGEHVGWGAGEHVGWGASEHVGWGAGQRVGSGSAEPSAGAWGSDARSPRSKRPLRRPRDARHPAARKRPRIRSRLERELCRLLR